MALDPSIIPAWVLVAAGVLALSQVALDVVALVDLAKRPVGAVAFGNKWVWVAIIVFVNLLGAILYLALGRRRTAVSGDTPASTGGGAPASNIADELYPRTGEEDAP
jgi:hypothetical protein